MYNPNFNSPEFEGIKNMAGLKAYERISAVARRDLYLNWDDVVRDVYEDYCTFVEAKRQVLVSH